MNTRHYRHGRTDNQWRWLVSPHIWAYGSLQSDNSGTFSQIWRDKTHKKRYIPPDSCNYHYHTLATLKKWPPRYRPRLYHWCHRLLFYIQKVIFKTLRWKTLLIRPLDIPIDQFRSRCQKSNSHNPSLPCFSHYNGRRVRMFFTLEKKNN